MEYPYIPLFTRNHRGMSGAFLDDAQRHDATTLWLRARDAAVESELRLLLGTLYDTSMDWRELLNLYYNKVYHAESVDHVPSVHKQNANRLIEPFMWHEALITSSYWDNFFHLRISDDAQPEMHALAVLMKTAMNASTPHDGMLHIPFEQSVDDDNWHDIMDSMMSSAAQCARISYHDRSTASRNDDNGLAFRMLHDGHLSPFEHQAMAVPLFTKLDAKYAISYNTTASLHGNLDPAWVQFRHIAPVSHSLGA